MADAPTPAAAPIADVFDAPVMSRAQLVNDFDASPWPRAGFTAPAMSPERLADLIAADFNLETPDGWTNAMRTLAGRREVLRRLVRDLTVPGIPDDRFHRALKYVTENGVGKPIERHEHLHRGAIGVVTVQPPIRWTDEIQPAEPPRITAVAQIALAAVAPTGTP